MNSGGDTNIQTTAENKITREQPKPNPTLFFQERPESMESIGLRNHRNLAL